VDLDHIHSMTSSSGNSGVTVQVLGLFHTFRGPEGPVPVLHQVELEAPAGSYLSITGPSGAGKSTLLALLGGLEPPQQGTVAVGGADLRGLRGDALAAYRRATVGFVFQHFGLVETLTALENVELAATLAGASRRQRRTQAHRLLAAVGLAEREGHRPARLSGGERQRVGIARALANGPRLVLADEPTGNLDEEAALSVIELLEGIHQERGCTVVLVTHNRSLAARAPRRLRLDRGRLHELG
jgi:putative ABC transport system ATP-binding protein